MNRVVSLAFVSIIAMNFTAGCTTSPPRTDEGKRALHDEARAALLRMEAKAPDLKAFLDEAYGYAIFPDIGKGAFIFGVAGGRGVVYVQGKMVGFTEVGQGTIGLQAGGQSYAELLAFQDPAAMDRFQKGDLEFAANASAVALDAGVGRSARYESGVAMFVLPNGGLMAEASIGGQKFYYQPADRVGWTPPTESAAAYKQHGEHLGVAAPPPPLPATTHPTTTTTAKTAATTAKLQINK